MNMKPFAKACLTLLFLTVANYLPAYTVTFNDQTATTKVNPGTKTVTPPATTTGTLPLAPLKTGYTFGGWWTETEGRGSQFTATSAVAASFTVYAKWVPNPVVAFSPGIEGVFSGKSVLQIPFRFSNNEWAAAVTDDQKKALNTAEQVGWMSERIIPAAPKILIGHSAGGLRNMAYAAKEVAEGRGANLKMLLSIGSPLKGWSPLASGYESLRRNLWEAPDRLSLGVASVIFFQDWPDMPSRTNESQAERLLDFVKTNSLVSFIVGISNFDLNKYTKLVDQLIAQPAYTAVTNIETISTAFRGIDQLNPGSGFFKENISSLQPVETGKVFTRRDYLGPVTNYGAFFSKLSQLQAQYSGTYYITPVIQDGYGFYDYFAPVYSYKMMAIPGKSIPSDTLVGHVVGGQADTLKMIADSSSSTPAERTSNFNGMKDGLGYFSTGMDISGYTHKTLMLAAGANATACTLSFQWVQAYALFTTASYESTLGDHAWDAKWVANNLQPEFNRLVYGTSAHDGYIPVSDQHPSENNVAAGETSTPDYTGGGNAFDGKLTQIKYFPDLNHDSERWDSRIWGTDGGFTQQKVGSTGLMRTTLQAYFQQTAIPLGKKIAD